MKTPRRHNWQLTGFGTVDPWSPGWDDTKRCEAPAVDGPCALPRGHNMGHADVPDNHAAREYAEADPWRRIEARPASRTEL